MASADEKIAESSESPDSDAERAGLRVREIREEMGMSARELAERAGLSPAYLSRLESGQINPTVSTLSKVMDAMRQPLWRCFADGSSSGPVVRRAQRSVISQGSGVTDSLVTPSRAGRLEIVETTIQPGGNSGGTYQHWNEEESIVILDGQLDFWLRETHYVLEAGDSITFACRIPHRWENSSDAPCTVLWIITPGGYLTQPDADGIQTELVR